MLLLQRRPPAPPGSHSAADAGYSPAFPECQSALSGPCPAADLTAWSLRCHRRGGRSECSQSPPAAGSPPKIYSAAAGRLPQRCARFSPQRPGHRPGPRKKEFHGRRTSPGRRPRPGPPPPPGAGD